MKNYIFLNNEYENLNDLAIAYKENFNEGINDIYANTKKLLAFVKSRTKNKDRIKAVKDNIYLTRYKNNALTFVIFELLDVKEVIINGKSITFKEFIELIKENPDKDNALFAFLEDHGVTRCFERLEPTMTYFKDMYYVERYFDHDLTYKYLCSLFDYDIKETLENKFISISIQNEECFRRASKYVKTDEFLLGVAHTYGFEAAINIARERNGLFYALILFKNDKRNDIEEDQLRRIVEDSFFWWLYDNFTNYNVKGKACNVYVRLRDIKIEYDNYTKKTVGPVRVSFDYFMNISRSLYLCYLEFVYYYKKGLIVPNNKKVTVSEFELDKPYCRTYIAENYMKGRVIKLYNPKPQVEEPTINPLTGEEIVRDEQVDINLDDTSDETPIDEISLADEDIYKKEKKLVNKTNRFASAIICFSVLSLIISLAGIAIIVIPDLKLIYFENLKDVISLRSIILFSTFSVLGIISGAILKYFESRKLSALIDLKYLNSLSNGEKISLEEEMHLYRLSQNEEKLKKLAFSNSRLFSTIGAVLLCVVQAYVAVILLKELSIVLTEALKLDILNYFNFKVYNDKMIAKLLCYLVMPVLAIPFAFFKKKRGTKFALLLVLLTFIMVALVIFLFTKIA